MTSSNETFFALLAFCAGNSPVNSQKGQWRGGLMFYLIYAWTNNWANYHEVGNLRRHLAHYGVIVMYVESVIVSLRRHCSCQNRWHITLEDMITNQPGDRMQYLKLKKLKSHFFAATDVGLKPLRCLKMISRSVFMVLPEAYITMWQNINTNKIKHIANMESKCMYLNIHAWFYVLFLKVRFPVNNTRAGYQSGKYTDISINIKWLCCRYYMHAIGSIRF